MIKIFEQEKIPKPSIEPATLLRYLKTGVSTGFRKAALELNDASLNGDGDGVRAVVGFKFGENVFDVNLNGFFRDAEFISHLFVAIPVGDELQDFHFACREMRLAEMLGDLLGNRRGNSRFSGVNEADDIEQFFAHHTFQKIAFRSGGKGAPDLHVA